MTIAHLQLEAYRLGALSVQFNEAWLDEKRRAEDEIYDVLPSAEIREFEDKGRYLVRLSVRCEPKSDTEGVVRFNLLDATAWGIFALADDTPQEQRDILINLNTVSILHGILRGIVIGVTGSCFGGQFILPAINYKEAFAAGLEPCAEDEERNSETAEETGTTTV